MIGVHTDIVRFDQQFLSDRKTQLCPLFLTALDPATGTVYANQPNFFGSQNNLEGKTITGIRLFTAGVGFDLTSLAMGQPISVGLYNYFTLTIKDRAGSLLLNEYPLYLLSSEGDNINNQYPYIKRFWLENVDWQASFVKSLDTSVGFGTTNSILFNFYYL